MQRRYVQCVCVAAAVRALRVNTFSICVVFMFASFVRMQSGTQSDVIYTLNMTENLRLD